MKLNYKKYSIAGLMVIGFLSAMIALALVTVYDKNEKQNVPAGYLSGDAESALSTAPDDLPANTPAPEAKATPSTTISARKEITTVQYLSIQGEGIIGNYAGKRIDNPADNIFTITTDRKFSERDKVWLCYELEGAEDFTCVPYCINDRLAKGGCLVKLSDKNSLQRERIHPAWLKKGENRITFTLPENAGFGYKVKNLSLEVERNTVFFPQLVVNTSQKSYGGKAYIRGFVQGAKGQPVVHLAGKEIQLLDGGFEAVLDLPAAKTAITATLANGNRLNKELVYAGDVTPDTVFALNNKVEQAEKTFLKGIPGKIELAAAALNVDSSGLLAVSKNIAVTTLRTIDLPALDMGMTNVTAESEGYRFLPHGEHFADGATVSIRYDRTKIPDGFTEDDIKTFYFDLTSRHWVPLERDSIDKANRLVVSRTTHFTDMINGVIQTPESPETNGFAPTMMKDIRAADPTAKVQVIAPPAANNRGSAGLNYVFEMPPARNGMQPDLGIQYNSDGGSGLLGEGWDLTLSSITVDTRWGVPRYNNVTETETYSMNGSMLMMMDADGESAVAHRGDKVNRTADRQFYMRQEGGFARIIRKGDDPGNYTWEVTDRSGTKYTYGAALKGNAQTLGGKKEVIAEWKLTRVEELHGDWIEYVYEAADEPVRDGLTAKAIYLKEVRAGNKESDAHTVVSLTSTSQKDKKTNSARYGFLTSSNRLLDKVAIAFEGETLRSYTFEYKTGAFNTNVLTKINHINSKGEVFASHDMDYYDDLDSKNGYKPFKSVAETWNLHDDGLNAGFINPVSRGLEAGDFADKPTALGGSKSSSTGGSMYVGVGPTGNPASAANTVGSSFSYSYSEGSGISTFVDINGDGIPDKVYVRNGSMYYRPGNVSGQFGQPIQIKGISQFSTSYTNTTSAGAKANITRFVTGTDKQTSNTKVSRYFADVNGDGLVDLVVGGSVYFNHIEFDADGNAVPVFTQVSGDTPSPINGGGIIDDSDTRIDPQEQAEMIANNPLQDAVLVWIAPYEGTVNITGNAQLLPPSGEYDAEAYDKSDGVRTAIQVAGSERWSKTIGKGDFASYPANLSGITVVKGQKIYFRVQSGTDETANGNFDRVKWQPSVAYTVATDDPNGYTNEYPFHQGYLVFGDGTTIFPFGQQFFIAGELFKPVTSDSIVLKVIIGEHVVDQLVFSGQQTYDNEIFFDVGNPTGADKIRCVISSKSNIAWEKIHWSPYILYAEPSGFLTPISLDVYRDGIYEQLYTQGTAHTVQNSGVAVLTSQPVFKAGSTPQQISGTQGTFNLTVKGQTGLIYRGALKIEGGVITEGASLVASLPSGKIWVELTSDDTDTGSVSSLESIQVSVQDSLGLVETVPASIWYRWDEQRFGPLHRNWGQFSYNAMEGRSTQPIQEDLLKLPESEDDPNANPAKMVLIPMHKGAQNRRMWQGNDAQVYVHVDEISASRMGQKDVILKNPLSGLGSAGGNTGSCIPGSGAVGVRQESKATSTSVMANGEAIGASGTLSTASGKDEVLLAFTDLNGDGYPDIISKSQIQLTNTRGGFDGEIVKHGGYHRSESSAKAVGIGGNPVHAYSISAKTANLNTAKNNSSKALGTLLKDISNKKACKTGTDALIAESAGRAALDKAGSQARFVWGAGLSDNGDKTVETFMDINGDGLPDKILSDKKVQLNLGFGFTEPVDWELDKIQEGSNTDVNLSMGYHIDASSWAVGIGVNTTFSNSDYTMTDVNADGLVDKVRVSGDKVYVSFNLGNSFAPEIEWKGITGINKNSSTGESINGAFTGGFTLPIPPIKIVFNPAANTGHSINRTLEDLRDVDGDGFPDIVSSDRESKMTVYRSAIARTNKLKSVNNPLGGSFTLDYTRSQATYDHPGGKWVMSSVETNDGLADDGANEKTVFEYRDGKQERHEREFLGFGKVIAKNIDTEASGENKVYRKLIREYDVSSVYTAGNELRTLMEDAEGNKYTESVSEYYSYKVTSSWNYYTFTADANTCTDRAIAFTPLKYRKSVVYEGEAEGFTTNEIFCEYYLDGYFGDIRTYTYSDKGALGSNGIGAYNYRTLIEYAESAAKYISGLPVIVQVRGNSGELYRQTEAKYDLNYANHITQIAQTLNDRGGRAVTDIEYDRYGNITKKTLPANYKGERMYYKYLYDRDYNMYVERVEDAFGYRSEMEDYDYRFGIPRVVRDMNGFTQETTLDDMGRITSILAPNEQDINVPYTIKFEYPTPGEPDSVGFTPLCAVTKHYDPQHPGNDIETVTFVDGFGRAVQVKKDGVVYENGADKEVMIVSGRAKFDAFGRAKEAYYPVTENTGTPAVFNPTFDNVSPTVTGYDILDRATKITLPDGSETAMKYTKDNGERTHITTVTDAEGGRQATFTNGSGLTVKTEQYSGPNGTITTRFEYDAIHQLLKAIDDGGNETLSSYDKAGRRIQVNHPVSGVTRFAYDNAGNLLSKQTANLAIGSKFITYDYEFNRLTAVNYPDHPENNVKYVYGYKNALHYRVGRLMLQEDGSGAQEFTYDRLGNVASVRRTLIIPNQAIATYVTQWKYDSWNRLEEMIYPDKERITYAYNTGGLLESVKGEKAYSYNYVNKLGYDKFEQRVYMKYCNGTETNYTYDEQRRRLSNLSVNSIQTAAQIMSNVYSYDAVDNVLSVANTAPPPAAGMGGLMSHTYGYDGLYRLVSATGTYTGTGRKTAGYSLEMEYDNLHNITGKKQHLQQHGIQFDGLLKAGYELAYHYAGNPFQLSTLDDENYRAESDATNGLIRKEHRYKYDANGNLVYVNTSREKKDSTQAEKSMERKLLWDEENRLEAIDDNGFVSNYWYDAAGERTVKTSGESEQMYVNSLFSGGNTGTANFTAYVNPYLVVSKGGKYTKHIYIGSQRIVSKLGDLDSYGADPRRIEYAGATVEVSDIDYENKYHASQQTIKDRYAKFEVPYLGKDNDDYVNGNGFCCDNADTNVRLRAMAENDNPEIYQYYYHADHLGSSSFITNLDGEIVQHIEYVPFGEVFIEERNNRWNTPYLFNAKELDEETGLYYYGARYYDPRTSVWLSADPSQEKYPNISTYAYAAQNPVKFIDPDGRKIAGVTEEDAQNFKADIHKVLVNEKFKNVRALIDVNGSTFISIDAEALNSALKGVTLTDDERTYIDMVTNTINSEDMHKIEYLSGSFTSSEGAKAFKAYMNKTQAGVGDKMLTPEGKLSTGIIDHMGGGLNVPTKSGSHSFIGSGVKGDERAITSGHELFGHGIPSAKKLEVKENNANAIRTDNLIRRLLGIPERDGSDHGGFKEGHITEPYKLPITK